MTRKITVTIKADITLEPNDLEKRIIDTIDNLDTDFVYDKLRYKLESLLLDRICKEMKDLKDVEIYDVGYAD